MKNRNMFLPACFSVALVVSLILPTLGAGTLGSVFPLNCHSTGDSTLDSSRLASAIPLSMAQGNAMPMVAAGRWHTVRLGSDGTVVAAGLRAEFAKLAKWDLL